jgi:hypothetical protein
MPNVLKDGLAYQTTVLKAVASEPVTYARGYDSVPVRAIFGRKLLKLDDNMGGLRVEWTDMDFLIPADADFTFGAGLIEPARGDIVWISVGSGYEAFEVLPFGRNEPAWRWSDPHRSMYRIHTKHIDTEQFYS